jgi:hypothetical protein
MQGEACVAEARVDDELFADRRTVWTQGSELPVGAVEDGGKSAKLSRPLPQGLWEQCRWASERLRDKAPLAAPFGARLVRKNRLFGEAFDRAACYSLSLRVGS